VAEEEPLLDLSVFPLRKVADLIRFAVEVPGLSTT